MTVHIDFRKWPDDKHWQFDMHPLGEDEHGTWLWAPPGTRVQRGEEPPRAWERLAVKLITRDWWSAVWSAFPGQVMHQLYVDIVQPAAWNGSTVTMIDVDLDVHRVEDGRVMMLDEDEFAEHQVQRNYPPELIAGAREAADRIFEAVQRGDEPFGATGAQWLARAITLFHAESSTATPS